MAQSDSAWWFELAERGQKGHRDIDVRASHAIEHWAMVASRALFLKTYRHLYEGEKRVHAGRLEAHVRASLDKERTSKPRRHAEGLDQANSGDGRTWDRTRDLSRVKRRHPLRLTAPARVQAVWWLDSPEGLRPVSATG